MRNYELKAKGLIQKCENLFEEIIKASGVSRLDMIRNTDPEEINILLEAVKLCDESMNYAVEQAKFMDEMIEKINVLERQNEEILEILKKRG